MALRCGMEPQEGYQIELLPGLALPGLVQWSCFALLATEQQKYPLQAGLLPRTVDARKTIAQCQSYSDAYHSYAAPLHVRRAVLPRQPVSGQAQFPLFLPGRRPEPIAPYQVFRP